MPARSVALITSGDTVTQAAARLSRRTVLRLSAASLVLLLALSWMVVAARGQPIATLFHSRHHPAAQLATGLVLAVAGAAVVMHVVRRAQRLARLREIVREVMAAVAPTRLDMLFVSLVAGVGEELFFRGALQPLVGLVPAAAIFALLHTGIPRRAGVAAFATYVFVMGLGLGALFQWSGLLAAMTAHAAFDFVLLVRASQTLVGEPLAGAESPG